MTATEPKILYPGSQQGRPVLKSCSVSLHHSLVKQLYFSHLCHILQLYFQRCVIACSCYSRCSTTRGYHGVSWTHHLAVGLHVWTYQHRTMSLSMLSSPRRFSTHSTNLRRAASPSSWGSLTMRPRSALRIKSSSHMRITLSMLGMERVT